MAKVLTDEEFFSQFNEIEEEETPTVENVEEKEEEVELEAPQEEEEEESPEVESEEDTEEDPKGEEDADEEEKSDSEEDEDSEEDIGIEFEDTSENEETIDFSSIAKDLGFEGEIKDKNTFLESYRSAIEKAKEDALSGIPDELKEAVSFAKEGGDFLSYLEVSSRNYDEVSNLDLVETSMEKYFKKEDGSVDTEALDEWLESKSSAEINMLGDQIRSGLKAEQSSKLEAVRAKAREEKAKSDRKLKTHIDSLNVIGGVKLKQSDKDSLLSDIMTGEAVKELFYEGGKLSQEKLAENLFKIRKFEQAIQLVKISSKAAGKREVLNNATNSNINRRSTKPPAEVKQHSPMDLFWSEITKKQ